MGQPHKSQTYKKKLIRSYQNNTMLRPGCPMAIKKKDQKKLNAVSKYCKLYY